MKQSHIVILVLSVIIASCSPSARITSIKDPNHPQYSRLLINATYRDIDDKERYENALLWALEREGIAAYRSTDAFPPLRDYSDSEVMAWVNRYHVDAILTLSPNGMTTGSSTSFNYLTKSYDTHETVDAIYLNAAIVDVKSGQKTYAASVTTIDAQPAADKLSDDLLRNGYLRKTEKPKSENELWQEWQDSQHNKQ